MEKNKGKEEMEFSKRGVSKDRLPDLSVGEVVELLRNDPDFGIEKVLSDRTLYIASTILFKEERSYFLSLFRRNPVLLRRVVGYGLYLLKSGEKEILLEPFLYLLLKTREGWEAFLSFLPLSSYEREVIENLQKKSFFLKPYRVLFFLSGRSSFKELILLWDLLEKKGNWLERIVARGFMKKLSQEKTFSEKEVFSGS